MDLLTMVGYGLAVTGSLAWIPQLHKIVKSRSGEGLNLVMFTVIDIITALISAFCIKSGLPYSNFAELLITNMQIFAIHALARFFLGQKLQLASLVVFKVVYTIFLAALPLPWLKIALNGLIPVMIFNRGSEVWRYYNDQSTGQLAGGTLLLQWIQFTGRICTSLLNGIVGGFLAPMAVNWTFGTIIGVQYLVYSSREKEEDKKKK